MKVKVIFIFLLAFGLGFSLYADEGTGNNPTLEETQEMLEEIGGEEETWATQLGGKIKEETTTLIDESIDDITSDIGTTIFEELTQFNLFQFKLGERITGEVKAYRRIFPNYDILNSYTIVDTYRIPVNIPLYSQSVPLGDIVGLSAGLSLGSSNSFEINNIRQAIPGKISSYPRFRDFLKKEKFLKGISWKKIKDFFVGSFRYDDAELDALNSRFSLLKTEIRSSEMVDDRGIKYFTTAYLEDPVNQARFGKIANIFLSPLKFPVKAKMLRHLHHGEIVSFTSNGYLHLSGNVGWNYTLEGITNPLTAQVSTTTYLNGTYRVSVLKENDRYAQVKITRLSRKGISKSFYPLTINHTLFDGIAVLGVDLGQKITFSPFRYSSGRSKSHSFERVYRYDLEQEDGVKAYEKAIFGMLVKSEQMSELYKEDETPAVQKVIEKETFSRDRNRSAKFEINYIFKATSSKNLSIGRSRIYLGSGKDKGVHYIKHGTSTKIKQWSSIFGSKERKQQTIQVSMDQNRLEKGEESSFGVSAKFFIEDNRTSGKELKRYVDQFNSILGFDGKFQTVFKPFPIRVPKKTRKSDEDTGSNIRNNSLQVAEYKKSNLYMHLQFGKEHIKTFLKTPEVVKKSILTQVFELSEPYEKLEGFNHDLDTRDEMGFNKARRVLKKWNKLSQITDYDELHLALSRFFHMSNVSYEDKVILFRKSLIDQNFTFQYNIFNEKLGRSTQSKKTAFVVDNVSHLANDLLNFDRIGNRNFGNAKAVVTSISHEKLKNGVVKVKIDLPVEPTFIFLKLDNRTLNFTRDSIQQVLGNQEKRFKKGVNTLTLDPESKDPIVQKFLQIYENSRKFRFSVAIALEDANWGGVKITEFNVHGLPEPEEEEDENADLEEDGAQDPEDSSVQESQAS